MRTADIYKVARDLIAVHQGGKGGSPLEKVMHTSAGTEAHINVRCVCVCSKLTILPTFYEAGYDTLRCELTYLGYIYTCLTLYRYGSVID